MSLLSNLLNLGKYKTTSFRTMIAGLSWGSMLFSFLFKKKATRTVAMKGFVGQGLGLLVIWGVAQIRKRLSSKEEIQKEPTKSLIDEKSTCRTRFTKFLGRC